MEQRMPWLILAGVVLLILIGLTNLPKTPQTMESVPADYVGIDISDSHLEQIVIDRMRAGKPYYTAAIEAMRQHHYCLRPFVHARLPGLAAFISMFPTNTIPRILLIVLSCAVVILWSAQMRSLATAVPVGLLLSFGILYAAAPGTELYQDAWVGPLIALSLAVHRKDWRLSLLFGVLAMSIREHALVLAVVMCLAAWRKRREYVAWAVVVVGFAVYLGIHAWIVNSHVLPDDRGGNAWIAFGGWPFIVLTGRWSFACLPSSVASGIIIPIALLGLASLEDYRPLAVVSAYIGAFLFVGGVNNWYWGLLYAPLLAVGLATGIPAFWILLKGIVRGNQITSSRRETVPGSDPQ